MKKRRRNQNSSGTAVVLVDIRSRRGQQVKDARVRQKAPANRPADGCLCIVMVCADSREAEQVSSALLELNSGCLITYRRAEDLLVNAPAGKIALIILAAGEKPDKIGHTLRWLKHRWPGCNVTVVGDVGSGDHELAAREGGAFYLTRPVSTEQWSAILSHALGMRQSVLRDRLDGSYVAHGGAE